MDEFRRHLTGNLTALARSLWAELGSGSGARRHRDCAVDPEPLILFSVHLARASFPLWREAADWCIQHAAYLSAWRLRRLRARASRPVQAAFDRFALAVGPARKKPGSGSLPWTGDRQAVGQKPLPLERPALVALRLRDLFGTGAASGVLLALLGSHDSECSLTELSELTGYSETNITKVLRGRSLQVFFSMRRADDEIRYRLLYRNDLESLLQELPERFPPWSIIFDVLTELWEAVRSPAGKNPESMHNRSLQVVRRLRPDLRKLQLPLPDAGRSLTTFWKSFVDWSVRLTAECALGNSIVFGPVLLSDDLLQPLPEKKHPTGRKQIQA